MLNRLDTYIFLSSNRSHLPFPEQWWQTWCHRPCTGSSFPPRGNERVGSSNPLSREGESCTWKVFHALTTILCCILKMSEFVVVSKTCDSTQRKSEKCKSGEFQVSKCTFVGWTFLGKHHQSCLHGNAFGATKFLFLSANYVICIAELLGEIEAPYNLETLLVEIETLCSVHLPDPKPIGLTFVT